MSIPRNLSKLAENTNSSGVLGVASGGTGGGSAAEAKTALGLHQVATTGSYTDLNSKPTTAEITESTNLYYTDARARAAISASGSLSYDSSTGALSYTAPTTSDITEGTNLYFTVSRARLALSASTLNGPGSISYNAAMGIISYTGPSDYEIRSRFSAGTGMTFNSSTGEITTTITQYSDALARGAISSGTGISYDAGTGTIANSDRGSSQSIFKNFTDGITTASADSNTDTFKFRGTNGVSLTIGEDDATHGDNLLIGLSNIPNSALANSSITINGLPVSLGGSRVLTTADVGEDTNLYFTNARAVAANTTAIATAKSEAIATASTDATNKAAAAQAAAIAAVTGGAGAAFDTLKEIQDAMATDVELANAISALTIGNATQTISAGTGLSGGGSFSANQTSASTVTLGLGTIGTSGTYTKVTTDAYGRVVSGGSLTVGDIPSLSGSYLPLSGGTLTGILNTSGGANSITINSTVISGGGGVIQLNRSAADKQIYITYGSDLLYLGVNASTSNARIGSATGTLAFSAGGYGDQATLATNGTFNSTNLTSGGNQVLHAGNYNSYALPLAGGTLTGNVSQTAGRFYAASAASGLAYTAPIFIRDTEATGSNNSFSGIAFASSPGADYVIGKYSNGGTGYLEIRNHLAASLWRMDISGAVTQGGVLNINADLQGHTTPTLYVKGDIRTQRGTGNTGVIYFGNSGSTYLYYDGSNYSMPSGQLDVNSSRVLTAGNYTSYSPSLGGSGASGTWGISITGSANYATTAGSATSATSAVRIQYNDGPRDLSDRLPNSFTRTVNFDFVGAGTGNGTGNYAGVMTYSPWSGTTASTGDSSYQLAFANTTGVNASGQPKLSIRNGIDSTWNSWYTLLHSGNYSSYALPLSGGLMTGDIRVNGNARFGVEDGGIDCYLEITDANPSYDGYSYGGEFFMYGDKSIDSSILEAGGIKSRTQVWVSGNRVLHAGNITSTESSNGINPDNVVRNQIGYNTSVSLFGQTDGGLYSSAYSSAWIHQIYGDFRSGQIAIRGKNSGTWQSWRTVLDSGNYSNYALPLSGGSVSGRIYANGYITTYQYDVYAGEAYGLRFWSSDSYKISMGSSSLYRYGTVTDYSIKMQMDNGSPGRGFTWGRESYGPVAALNATTGSFQTAGAVKNGNNLAIPNASWGAGGDVTGMVIFKFPGSSGNYGMVHMVFDIYEYSGNAVSTIIIGGHNWAGNWYNTGASVIGQCGKQVRLGYKDGQYCVVFGDSGSVWSYGQIVLRKIQNGAYYDNNMDLGAAFDVVFTSTESFSTIGGDLRQLRTPASFNAGGAITQAGNQVLHAGNYTNYTDGRWAGFTVNQYNSNNIRFYGNSSTDLGFAGVSSSGAFRWQLYGEGSNYGFLNGVWAGWDLRKTIGGNLFINDNIALNAANYTNYTDNRYIYARNRTNYNDGTVISNVVGQLAWKNYGNNHTIFDASNSTTPDGGSCDRTNSYYTWNAAACPTLMGWNGGQTYGVRVDSARLANRTQRADGNLYIDDDYGYGHVGVYSSYRYQGVFAMGDSYKLPADGTTTGNLYGIAWSHPNAGGTAGNLDSHGLLVLINGGYASSMSYSIKASSNVTAYSDERLKTNWRAMPDNYVSRLAQVRVGIYDRIDGEKITQVGVGAQSLQKLLPQAIETANDEMQTLSVNYGSAALASAVELAKYVVEQDARIARLEALIETLLKDR